MPPPRGSTKPTRGFLTPVHSLSGCYELLGRLGSGGMAEVYLARAVGLEDFEFEKIVVLKRVLPERMDDRRYAAMFRDEARVAATLEHPNIVHTYDIGIKDDECFFTMEYLHGEDLKAILTAANKVREQLPLELALKIAVGCAAGLHHAHEQTDYAGRPLHIVHRDVSPSNVIVTRQSGVKLIDFGIAKAASDKEHTGVGVLKGKVAYMSPEQCRGEVLDRRSDIFAMGIVLYEMVTMERPYKAGSVLGTVHKLLGEEPPPPRQLRPECPPALERIVLKALEKDPAKRYQTAFEMQEELELVTRDHQLHALPGALGRYLEHLFGPKPHPWRQHATRPPAVPRWAWTEMDSTVTSPREPKDAPGSAPERWSKPLPKSLPPTPAGAGVVARSTPQQRTTVPVPHAEAPPPTAPMSMHPPTGAHLPVGSRLPTGAHAPVGAAPPTGSYVSVPIDNTYASEVPAELGAAIARPPSSTPGNGWALKHLLLGGVVGGLVAVAGVSLWNARTPSITEGAPASTVAEPAAEAATDPSPSGSPPSLSMAASVRPIAVAAPAPPAEAASAGASDGDVEPAGADSPGNEIVDDDAARTSEPDASRTADDGARAARMIERARTVLFEDPKAAYREAKASYELRSTQTALQLMGLAACRMRSQSKAQWAYRRLRGKTQRELEAPCEQLGIELE